VNLSQRRRIVVFLVVLLLLFVAAGFVVGPQERANTPLGQVRDGVRGGLSIANSPTSLALLLGLSGPVVAALAIFATDRRERARQDHERKLKQMELEDQRQSRLRDERRQAYFEFLARWHSYEDARTRTPRNQEEFEKANLAFQRSFNALSLIAPNEVRAAADAIRQEEVPGRRQEAAGAPGRFLKVAREDLGIPD
jgi:hypothetical protein